MKNKQQEGITLIALVITIIVLLILAGVAINLATDSNGLFAKANEAVTKWNASVAEEDRTIEKLLNKMNEINGETVEQSSISLNKTTLALEIVDGVNANETLVATKEHIDGTVTWTSSVPSVATVDSNGKVTTVGEGETTITASCGGYSATCTVTVTTRTTIKRISFTINGETYYAVEGWDWATWIEDTNYNTIGAYLNSTQICFKKSGTTYFIEASNGSPWGESSTSTIVEGCSYSITELDGLDDFANGDVGEM